MKYADFIDAKSQMGTACGFEPVWMPDFLKDFQAVATEWSIRKGRTGIFADCGLGKSVMDLVWGENVVRKTNLPVLLFTPIAVGAQMLREAEKFGIEAERSDGGNITKPKVYITNYEKRHKFTPSDFAGVICDESSILKNFDGRTRDEIIEFMRLTRYRLLSTATAAPNDYVELGNSAEALGEMGFQDMVTKFFRKGTSTGNGWGRVKYELRTHARRDFWRWVCSWARAFRMPSDLGFDNSEYVLPPLIVNEHLVKARQAAAGMLFDLPAKSLQDQREERRRTLRERCEMAADIANRADEPVVVWCELNDEGDYLESLIPDAEQVSGSDTDERKEEILTNFGDGKIRVLVTKPILAGFGMNWQHCARQTYFPTHSFEQYYQSMRRSWRFGQKRPVTIDIITTEGNAGVKANLQRKAEAADAMFAHLVELMNDSLRVKRGTDHKATTEKPSWLVSIK